MRVQRIDHLHAYANDVDAVARLFSDLFGMTCDICEFGEWGLRTVVVRTGRDRRFIEFLQPTDPNGEVARFLGPRSEGLICVDFKVPDIDRATAELESRGIKQIHRSNIGKVKQAWFESKNTFGMQIELSEYPGDNIFVDSGIPFLQNF